MAIFILGDSSDDLSIIIIVENGLNFREIDFRHGDQRGSQDVGVSGAAGNGQIILTESKSSNEIVPGNVEFLPLIFSTKNRGTMNNILNM